jgi:HEAT repeat protein
MMRAFLLSLFVVCLTALVGCQSVPWPDYWPFPDYEHTTYTTPKMRVDAVTEYGARSTGVDTPDQREITDQLARQIQIEPDPLVRQAVIHSIRDFRTPMAQQVLEAGLSDQDKTVRVACCEALGERGDAASVSCLATALKGDKDVDVRIAAAKALGGVKSPEAIQALTVALEDRDPALQYVGVQSMKSITGKDYGPDVQAWRQVAAGQTPAVQPAPSVASRLRKAMPF